MNEQKFLSHFGVPGMHWGIRRAEKLNSKRKDGQSKTKMTSKQKVEFGRLITASLLGSVAGGMAMRKLASMAGFNSDTSQMVARALGASLGASTAFSLATSNNEDNKK